MPLCNVAVKVYLVIIFMVHNRFILLPIPLFHIIFIQLTLYMIEIQIQINNFGKGTVHVRYTIKV